MQYCDVEIVIEVIKYGFKLVKSMILECVMCSPYSFVIHEITSKEVKLTNIVSLYVCSCLFAFHFNFLFSLERKHT